MPLPTPTLPDLLTRLRLLAAIAVVVVLVPAGAASARERPAAILRLVNAARAAHHQPPVRFDARLAVAARGHSREMVAQHYFAHDSRSGERFSSRITRTGWMRGRRHWHVGENLAWGIRGEGRPSAIVSAWLHSPSHRHVLLDPDYRVIGIGTVRGTPFADPSRGWTYTADFGS
jgi:uncharacterized protein YkwD